MGAIKDRKGDRDETQHGGCALFGMLLAGGFDERWVRYLGTLLSDPLGENTRNELLHGLRVEVRPLRDPGG
jgi:hypothetical protein